MDLRTVVDGLKKHAIENYNTGGWDYLVECYEDSEIYEVLVDEKATTLDQAIKVFGERLGIMDSHRRDIMGTAF